MSIIQTDSLEIFKTNQYYLTDIGMVSDNAYLSIVATNNCQKACPYCINSETDRHLNIRVDKAVTNIRTLVDRYHVKEAIILGGEPLLHRRILELVSRLRKETGLEMLRLTTNGIALKDGFDYLRDLFDPDNGIQGINISCHNGKDFMSYDELREICFDIKNVNPKIKIRINTNIWRGNLDEFSELLEHIRIVSEFADEIRISNIIPKDSFSVNDVNDGLDLILSDDEYEDIFKCLVRYYFTDYTIIRNDLTLGFVRYLLIPTPVPIIINWNIGSKVAEQVCENDIKNRKINTFKCLVDGSISLSWNKNNVIIP